MRYRWWITITVCIFAAGLAVGMARPDIVGTLLQSALGALQELSQDLKPYELQTFARILFQNASTLLLSFLLSPLLCLFPVTALFLNGTLVGYISVIATQQVSAGFVLAGLLAHGFIEIPAIIIGEAAALSFGATAILSLFSPEFRSTFVPRLRQSLKYLALAGILLLPAAVIETFLTPWILQVMGY
jgi:stage II sporulation protein M